MNWGRLARRALQVATARAMDAFNESRYRSISSSYNLHGFKRVYFAHIRKTGGTSLNHMFLGLSGGDSNALYSRLSTAPRYRLEANGLVYVGWNTGLINQGNYFYAFSHTPLHKLRLPPGTFVVSTFRDPVRRVLSHYNMLRDYRDNGIDHPCMATEGAWLGNSFEDFIERVPKMHLLCQLYMFSERYDIAEALDRVDTLSHWFLCEQFDEGVNALNAETGLALKPMRIRVANSRAEVPHAGLARLRALLADEYEFLERVQQRRRVPARHAAMG